MKTTSIIRNLSNIAGQIRTAQTAFDIAFKAGGIITQGGGVLTQSGVEYTAFDSLELAQSALTEQIEELKEIQAASAFDRFDTKLLGGNV